MTPLTPHPSGSAGRPRPPESPIGSVAVGRYILELGAPSGTLISAPAQATGADASSLAEAIERKSDERAVAPLEGVIDPLKEATDKAERAVGLFKALAERARDPEELSVEQLSGEIDLLLSLIERLDRDGRWPEALRLARAASDLFALARRWVALVRSLTIALRAAEEVGDSSAAAWAWHELGTVHLAAEDASGAERALQEAHAIRDRLGDRRGLAATEHNLQVLCQRLRELLRERRLAPSSRRRLLLTVAAAIILFAAGVAAGAVIAGDDGDDSSIDGGAPADGTTGADGPAPNGDGSAGDGDGPSPVAAELSPTDLDFERAIVGTTSEQGDTTVTDTAAPTDPLSITATNTGPVTITLGAFQIAGTHPSDFAIASDGCSNTPLPSDGRCSVEVQFTPTATGDRSATLTLDDDGTGTEQGVALSGFGYTVD